MIVYSSEAEVGVLLQCNAHYCREVNESNINVQQSNSAEIHYQTGRPYRNK